VQGGDVREAFGHARRSGGIKDYDEMAEALSDED
jgi:hypothetical protein